MQANRYAISVVLLASALACAQTTSAPPAASTPAPAPATTPAGATAPHPAAEPAITQSGDNIHISVKSTRPLAQALDALRQKYGWLVGYEDPGYFSKLDLVDRPSPNGVPARFPVSGAFVVDIPSPASATAPPPEEKTLQIVVDAFNQSKNPGRFELRKLDDGGYAVAGTGAQDDAGKIVVQKVPFDLPIEVPKQQRTASDTINLICEKIAAQTHVPMTVGVTPRLVLDHKDVTVGGKKIAARELLASVIAAVGKPMYWRLLFDPTTKGYFLDVHGVLPK